MYLSHWDLLKYFINLQMTDINVRYETNSFTLFCHYDEDVSLDDVHVHDLGC